MILNSPLKGRALLAVINDSKDVEEPIERFSSSVLIRNKLAVVLWQFPGVLTLERS